MTVSDEAPFHPPVAQPLGDVTTERLELRRFEHPDLDALADVFAKPEVWHYPYGRGFTRAETAAFLEGQVEAWEADGFGLWLATERASCRVIGYAGLSVPVFLRDVVAEPAVEVGWRFDPDVWGRGFARESATAALDQAFGPLGLDRVCSVVQIDNQASVRVAERLGMTRERDIEVQANEKRGTVLGTLYWITATEWPSRR